MSRKTLLLCLVAVACFMTADAFWSEKVEHAKKVLTDMIDGAIADFQHAVYTIKERALEDMETIRQRALEITQDVYDSINEAITSVLRQLDEKVAKLTEKADGVDISECTAMVDQIHNTALAVIANTSACVTDRIERGTGYVENIAVTADEVVNKLTEIGHEATDCTREATGIEGTVKALGCLAVATKDAVVETTKRIPAVLLDLTKLSALVGTIIPQLQLCALQTSTAVVVEDAHEVATTVEACVEEKINQYLDRGSTSQQPTSSHSTPEVTIPTRPPTTPTTPTTAPPSTTESVQRPLASFEEDNDDVRSY